MISIDFLYTELRSINFSYCSRCCNYRFQTRSLLFFSGLYCNACCKQFILLTFAPFAITLYLDKVFFVYLCRAVNWLVISSVNWIVKYKFQIVSSIRKIGLQFIHCILLVKIIRILVVFRVFSVMGYAMPDRCNIR